MKERKVTDAQRERAKREMLAAIDIHRREGRSREEVLQIAASMYDFNVRWADAALERERAERERGTKARAAA